MADQIPHLALACHAAHDPEGRTLDSLISSHILPIVTTLLGDPNKMVSPTPRALPSSCGRLVRSTASFLLFPQIHKTAQGALLALLEQGLLPPRVVEEKLVPLVVSWCSVDDAELNTSAVGVSTIHYICLP